jgi:hypothetical protein
MLAESNGMRRSRKEQAWDGRRKRKGKDWNEGVRKKRRKRERWMELSENMRRRKKELGYTRVDGHSQSWPPSIQCDRKAAAVAAAAAAVPSLSLSRDMPWQRGN